MDLFENMVANIWQKIGNTGADDMEIQMSYTYSIPDWDLI